MAELRRELNVSYLFISHDISTVRAICDDIVVLYAGRKVEAGSATDAAGAAVPSVYGPADLLGAGVAPRLARTDRRSARRCRRIGAIAAELRGSPICARFCIDARCASTASATSSRRRIASSATARRCSVIAPRQSLQRAHVRER